MRLMFLFIVISIAHSSVVFANESLQAELIEMGKLDQQIRKKVGEAGWQNASPELLDELKSVDKQNTLRLEQIVDEHSWPTSDLVGKDGVQAAFLIVQHSPDLAFKEKMLPLLKESYLKDEGISGQELALLTDRILVSKGEKQIYGTQAEIVDSGVVIKPIAHPELVDQRRREMEMVPLDVYIKLLEEAYGLKDHADID